MSLLSIRGRFSLDGTSLDSGDYLTWAEMRLMEAGAVGIKRQADSLMFTGDWGLLGSTLRVLHSVGHSTVRHIDGRTVEYEFSITGMVVVRALAVLMIGLFLIASRGSAQSWAAVPLWIGLFAGEYLFTAWRLRGLVIPSRPASA